MQARVHNKKRWVKKSTKPTIHSVQHKRRWVKKSKIAIVQPSKPTAVNQITLSEITDSLDYDDMFYQYELSNGIIRVDNAWALMYDLLSLKYNNITHVTNHTIILSESYIRKCLALYVYFDSPKDYVDSLLYKDCPVRYLFNTTKLCLDLGLSDIIAPLCDEYVKSDTFLSHLKISQEGLNSVRQPSGRYRFDIYITKDDVDALMSWYIELCGLEKYVSEETLELLKSIRLQ